MAKKSKPMPVEKLKATTKKPLPVKIVSEAAEIAPNTKERDKWRAEDDLRVLQKACEINKDKSRLKAASMIAKEQMEALKRVIK